VSTTKPDSLAPIETAQAILAAPDATLDQLEEAKLSLQRVVAGAAADLEEVYARRKIELTAATPANELDKKLDALDKRKKEIERRTEVASIVLVEVESRLVDARETERALQRQAAYDAAVKLRDETATLVRNFLDNVGPAARAALQAYAASEAATRAANADLPPGAMRIPSIESARQGAAPEPKVVERPFRAFTSGGRFVAEVGSVEASPSAGGIYTLYIPSNSVQGGEVIGGCTIEDFVDVRIETFSPSRPRVLSSALSVPEFFAPAPARGSIEKKRMRLVDWRAINGEPAEAEELA
jgi:hypothetical protein